MKKMNFSNRAILLGVLFLISYNIYSSEVIYNRNEQTGLTHMYITDIVKDSTGFIWFGTARGLNRWDGYKYKYYLSDKSDTSSISNNKIQSLLLDKNNLIWVATSNGLNLFDSKSDKFKHFLHDPNNKESISSNNIYSITEDQKGNIWLGTNKGINIYNKKTKNFSVFEYENLTDTTYSYNNVRTLYCDSKNNIYAGFDYSGLLKINANTLNAEFFLFDEENNYVNSILDICQIDSSNLLLSTWGGKIFNFSIKQNKIEKWSGNYLLDGDVIDQIEIDNNGNYWISDHYNKILHISSQLKLIDEFSINSELNPIPSNQTIKIYNDDKNIWIGTLTQGFYQIEYSQKPITTLNWETLNQAELNNYKITAITQGRPGELIFGTSNNEIFILNEKNKKIKRVPIKNNVAYRIYYDKYREKIFYGSYANSFNSIDINTFKEKNEIEFNSPITIYGIASNDSIVMLAIWGKGLSILDKNGVLEHQGSTQSEKYFSTLNMVLDGDNLWLATIDNGLLKFNLKTKQFKSYLIQNQTSSSILATNQINEVILLNNGDILIISNELGICYFDQINEKFIPVGKELGIGDVNVNDIVEDNDTNIWIITEKEVIKTNYQFNKLSQLSILDGLNYGISHLASSINPETNNIFIGGQEGVQRFNTKDLDSDSVTRKVVITDFKVFEKSLEINSPALNGVSISYKDSITLSYKQNFITIDFSSMQYNNKTNREFSYKLSGVNNNWISVPNFQNSVTYSNLSPGDYLFEVKVSNEHGIWQNSSSKLSITISPPFWLTSWFRFIILVFIVTIIVTFVRLREYNLIQEKQKLEHLVEKRTRELRKQKNKVESQNIELENANNIKNKFFNIIAHDLKNPVGSMVQLTDLLKENHKLVTKEELTEIIQSVSYSANSTMDLLEDLLVWARSQTDKIVFDIKSINIYSVISGETLILQQQARNKNIIIKNNIPENVYVLADIDSVKTIIRNLLSNAIKFSHKNSTIIIKSENQSEFLKISIIDSGIGIPYLKLLKLFEIDQKNSTAGTGGERGTGLGLNLCNEFVKRNGGVLKVKSVVNEGSEFSFTLALDLKS